MPEKALKLIAMVSNLILFFVICDSTR
jgi:hypothetical protein